MACPIPLGGPKNAPHCHSLLKVTGYQLMFIIIISHIDDYRGNIC